MSSRCRSRTGARRPTRCRSSATRRKVRSSSSGSRGRTPPSLFPSFPDPLDSGAGTALRRRPRRLPHRDGKLADVVLPAAIWGEKTGTFTNLDRTVHLSKRRSSRQARRVPTSTCSSTSPADGLPRQGRRAPPQVEHGRGVPSTLGGNLARAAVRLQRADLREAPRRHRHPVAVTDAAPDGTERMYTDVGSTPKGTNAGLGPRPRDRRGLPATASRRAGGKRKGDPQGRAFPARRRDARRRLSVVPRDRANRLPLPHPHEDRPSARAGCGSAGAVGRARADGCRERSASPRATSVRGDAHREARSWRRRGSATSARATRSSRSTTATGTNRTAASRTGGRERQTSSTITAWDPVSKQPLLKAGKVKVEKA